MSPSTLIFDKSKMCFLPVFPRRLQGITVIADRRCALCDGADRGQASSWLAGKRRLRAP